jgi:hypothetical protein
MRKEILSARALQATWCRTAGRIVFLWLSLCRKMRRDRFFQLAGGVATLLSEAYAAAKISTRFVLPSGNCFK